VNTITRTTSPGTTAEGGPLNRGFVAVSFEVHA
jgi:hypothetical protein